VNTLLNIQHFSVLSAVLGVHTHARNPFADPCGAVQRHQWVKTLQRCVHHLTVNTPANIQQFSILSAVLGVHTHQAKLRQSLALNRQPILPIRRICPIITPSSRMRRKNHPHSGFLERKIAAVGK
jgi:hypothetical protein